MLLEIDSRRCARRLRAAAVVVVVLHGLVLRAHVCPSYSSDGTEFVLSRRLGVSTRNWRAAIHQSCE